MLLRFAPRLRRPRFFFLLCITALLAGLGLAVVWAGANPFAPAASAGSAAPLAQTFVVTKTADTDGTCSSGADCSLRAAIAAANAAAGAPSFVANSMAFASSSDTTQNITQTGNYRITVRGADGGNLSIFI